MKDLWLLRMEESISGFVNDVDVDFSENFNKVFTHVANGDYGGAWDLTIKFADKIEILLFCLNALQSAKLKPAQPNTETEENA